MCKVSTGVDAGCVDMISSPPGTQWSARRVALATLVLLAVLLAFYLLYRFYIVVFILFVAIVIAVAIRPLVEWLFGRGVPRPLGVILVYLALLAFVCGFFVLLTPLLVDQVTTIAGRLPDYYHGLVGLLAHSSSTLLRRLVVELPPTLALPANQPAAAAEPPLNAVGQALGYLRVAVRTAFVATSIFVLAFYWTLEGERNVRTLLLRIPADYREATLDIIASMEEKVGAYIRGVVILSASVAVMASAAYLITGLPYALVLGLIAGVLETLPVLGPVIGAVPPLLLALSLEPSKAFWVLLAVIVIQQIEGNVLVPRVMDRAVGVNAIVTILAIAAFGSLFGIAGAIMAIPLAAVIQVLLDRFVFDPGAAAEGPEGRDRYSMLRYEAQQLVQDVRRQLRHKDEVADGQTDQLEDMIEAIATDIDSALAQMQLPAEER